MNHSQWISAKEHYRYAQDTHDQRNQISDGTPGFKRRDEIRRQRRHDEKYHGNERAADRVNHRNRVRVNATNNEGDQRYQHN